MNDILELREIMNEMNHSSGIYSFENINNMVEDDVLDPQEEGFMRGYLNA